MRIDVVTRVNKVGQLARDEGQLTTDECQNINMSYSGPMLSGVDAIHVATVLEDCVDQLSVLGRIMPVSFEFKPDAMEIVRGDLAQLVDRQVQLESKYQSVLSKKMEMIGSTKNPEKLQDVEQELLSAGGDLKNSTHVFGRTLRQNPLTQDNLVKIQEDRVFLESVMGDTMTELVQNCSFQALLEAVNAQKQHKASLQSTIQKEEDGRKKVRELQRQLLGVKKQKETEIQQRNEMISHLKDQLQEMKAKTNMEGKYIKKCAEVAVAQSQKRCFLSEKDMKEEIERLQVKIDEEVGAHQKIVSYLQTHQKDLEKKLEFWIDKYETDKEAKQKELDTLKQTKAKDLEKLQELTKLYKEYEQIVVEDRIEKEKARRKAEQEAIELRSAIRLQAWWRGVMVRKGFGPFGKKKKGKGKKGKGKGKKGKKKK
ncbi:dynein regulatory complex protein 9 [Aplysia californica]|uniref:Dynein regulatory complex protein 9 n=1 Tax=Aplysia californica TaxID=6500 RepID=A0ABM0JYS7_APLCA|nr:dynein regulatory complex protein 9 [Aplysia californica]